MCAPQAIEVARLERERALSMCGAPPDPNTSVLVSTLVQPCFEGGEGTALHQRLKAKTAELIEVQRELDRTRAQLRADMADKLCVRNETKVGLHRCVQCAQICTLAPMCDCTRMHARDTFICMTAHRHVHAESLRLRHTCPSARSVSQRDVATLYVVCTALHFLCRSPVSN